MRIIVTGAAGFIGSHLCERLIKEGQEVIGIDNFNDFYEPAIKRSNIAELSTRDEFTLSEIDIRDEAAITKVMQKGKVGLVIHLAAMAGVRPSIENPALYQDVNITGTTVLLEACRKHDIEKFIFASSSSVYGNNKKVPFCETDNVDYPISPYAATKKAGELLCHTYHHLFDMDITCLRFFTVYGPRQRPDLAIHKFARLIESDKAIPVFGDGSMSRDYTFIDDIVNGVMAAVERCRGYEIYNLGNSHPIRLDELVAKLERVLGKKAKINRLPVPAGDVRQTFADIHKAEKQLGYQPKTGIDEGLALFVAWLRR